MPTALVLAADTVVECEGEILVKPNDPDDARRMLAALSGKVHAVFTAYALTAGGNVIEAGLATSHVTFRPLTAAEIEDYVASGEPMDKAGAYGIQGRGTDFIIQVEGSRDNVMGLPMPEVLAALAGLGILPAPNLNHLNAERA